MSQMPVSSTSIPVSAISANKLPVSGADLDRRKLATTPFIIPHEQGRTAKGTGSECAHVFLHPLTWMRPSLYPNSIDSSSSSYGPEGPLSGRLTCPNSACGHNIGKFAWAGMQCSCGTWVVPAIGVAKARVDVTDRVHSPRGPAALGIRMPPGMKTNETGPGRGNL